MARTAREIKMKFRDKYDIVIPAGQPVSKCPHSTAQYFVENFGSFINEVTQWSLYHDAKFYGIRVEAADVTQEA